MAFNTGSLLRIGLALEQHTGSLLFLFTIAGLALLQTVYLIYLTLPGSPIFHNLLVRHGRQSFTTAGVGFSGVLFALKVLYGGGQPMAWAPSLLVAHVFVRNSSTIGHFAGVLAGYTWLVVYPVLAHLVPRTSGGALLLLGMSMLLWRHRPALIKAVGTAKRLGHVLWNRGAAKLSPYVSGLRAT